MRRETCFHATHAAPVNVKNITTTATTSGIAQELTNSFRLPLLSLSICIVAHQPWRLPTVPSAKQLLPPTSSLSLSHFIFISWTLLLQSAPNVVGTHQIELVSLLHRVLFLVYQLNQKLRRSLLRAQHLGRPGKKTKYIWLKYK